MGYRNLARCRRNHNGADPPGFGSCEGRHRAKCAMGLISTPFARIGACGRYTRHHAPLGNGPPTSMAQCTRLAVGSKGASLARVFRCVK